MAILEYLSSPGRKSVWVYVALGAAALIASVVVVVLFFAPSPAPIIPATPPRMTPIAPPIPTTAPSNVLNQPAPATTGVSP
jgi:hypothetical protein